MKVKPEIQEKIVHAANILVSEGIANPTNDQVRERMGGGSLSHISPVMREWRKSQRTESVPTIEMPDDLKQATDFAMARIWASAYKLAQAAFQSYRDESDIAAKEAAKERDEALTEIQSLEEKTLELIYNCNQKDEELTNTTKELMNERSLRAILSAENRALTEKIEDNKTLIAELKTELSEARSNNKVLQEQLIAIIKDEKNT